MSKTIYLIGGIGNVLFQLFEGFKQGDNMEFNTYFIQPNILTNSILKWTIHENDVLPAIENMQFISKAPPLHILVRLLLLRKIYSDEFFYGRGLEINNNLFGYYQDIKVDKVFNQFVSDFRNRLKLPGLSNRHDNVLHIRLGDSVWAKGKLSYYLQAFDILSQYGLVTIVTDESEAVRLILNESGRKQQNYEILSISTLETFTVMTQAKYLAVAPSTFSWWASQISIDAELVMEKEMFEKFGSNKPVRWLL